MAEASSHLRDGHHRQPPCGPCATHETQHCNTVTHGNNEEPQGDTNIVTNIDDEDIKYKVVPTLLIEEEHMFITERARNHVVDIM